MTQKYKGHRLKKDGTYESKGEVHARLTTRFNAKVAGATTLGLISLGAFFDMAVSNSPVLHNAMYHVVNNIQVADQLARIVDAAISGASAAGAIWTSFSAARDARKITAVGNSMASSGKDRRPGDRAREAAFIEREVA